MLHDIVRAPLLLLTNAGLGYLHYQPHILSATYWINFLAAGRLFREGIEMPKWIYWGRIKGDGGYLFPFQPLAKRDWLKLIPRPDSTMR